MNALHHIALNCINPRGQESFYSRHFGFKRARVFNPGTPGEFVMLRLGGVCIELFPSPAPSPASSPASSSAPSPAQSTHPSHSSDSSHSSDPSHSPSPAASPALSPASSPAPLPTPSPAPLPTPSTAPSPAPNPGEQPVGFKHLAFEVASLEETIRGLKADGVETGEVIDCGPVVPGLRICFFKDPEGNSIEIMQGWSDDANPPAF